MPISEPRRFAVQLRITPPKLPGRQKGKRYEEPKLKHWPERGKEKSREGG